MKEMSKKNNCIWINPPPSDGNCECCGKHISELKPYGKSGDLFFDDYNKEFLLKKFRRGGTYDEKAEKAVEKALNHYAVEGYKDPLEWMIKKYGKKEAEKLYYRDMACNQVGASWECKDCFFLNTDEYFKELDRR